MTHSAETQPSRRSTALRVLFGPYASAVPLGLAVAAQVVVMVAEGQTFATGASAAVPTWLLFAAGFALMVVAPGWLLVELVLPRREATDALERALLSIGAGFGILVAVGLLNHLVPWPLVPGYSTRMIFVTGVLAVLLARRSRPERDRGPTGSSARLRTTRPGGRPDAGSATRPRSRDPLSLPRSVPRSAWLQVAAVVAFGALLRLPDIGYAEVQGDEATIMLKAAAALQGRTDAIFVHKKGPAEIVIASAFYALEDRAEEALVRLPFAFATLAGLAVVYLIGRAMFSPAAGVVAGLLLGVNGFFVGFARIVQYQSIVFLMSALAIWCAWRLSRSPVSPASPRSPDSPASSSSPASPASPTSPNPPAASGTASGDDPAWIGLGAFFVAIGLMAHYDTVFALPPIAWLVWRRWRAAGPASGRFDVATGLARADFRRIGWAALGAAVLLGIFFVPLALHPYFRSTTLDYLVQTRLGGDGGDGLFHNALLNSATLATFYSSTWLMLAVAVLLLVELGRRLAAPALALAIGTALAVALARPEWTRWGPVDVTFPLLLAVAAAGLWRARADDGWKAVWLWFVVPLAVYGGLVKSPRTHFHVAFPAWMLLASLPVAAGWRMVGADAVAARRGARRIALALAGGAAYLLFAAYAWWTFVQHDVEYRRAYPAGTPPGQWVALPDLPSSGWFGFPYRAGWKTIGALYGQGLLHGDYHSNEEEWVTHWYTRGQPRCDDRPRYLFVAEGVQDERPIPADPAAEGYVVVAEITRGGQPRIAVWQRADLAAIDPHLPAPPAGLPAPRFAVETAEPLFDAAMSGSRFDTWLPYTRDLELAASRPMVDFGGRVRLVAVRTDPPDLSAIAPGERVIVTLLWEAIAPMDKDYSIFLHLEEEGVRMLAQDDGAPSALGPKGACGEAFPTTRWAVGERVVERRVIEVPADALDGDGASPSETSSPGADAAPEGRAVEIPLLVGLYDYETLERLPVTDRDGADLGGRFELAMVGLSDRPSGGSGSGDPPDPPWLRSADPLGAAPWLFEPLRPAP